MSHQRRKGGAALMGQLNRRRIAVCRTSRGKSGAILISAALLLGLCGGCADTKNVDPSVSIYRTPTRVDHANIVGAGRVADESCLAHPAPLDPGAADPQRIVVADPSLLDGLCSLGMQTRIVGTATDSTIDYLGSAITSLPSLGPASHIDINKIASLHPDLILTTSPHTATTLTAVGARVVVVDNKDWRTRFISESTAVGRKIAGEQDLRNFDNFADATGKQVDAAHTEASLVRFSENAVTAMGSDNFASSVLTQMGVARPRSQRGVKGFTVQEGNYSRLDGDLIYVSFDGNGGRVKANSVMNSTGWFDLRAVVANRQFVVNDHIWYGPDSGIVAAFAIVQDVKDSINATS